MVANIYGGGANTNVNGLRFEQATSLSEALQNAGYILKDHGCVYRRGEKKPIALNAPKHKLYERILQPNNINWRDYISKQMLPDEALLNKQSNSIYIIEKKFQSGFGSVDEKLQTCDFKKKQYQKLFAKLGITVEYMYVCNDWFLKEEYQDVRQYIESVQCHIYFGEIPLQALGL